MIKKKIQTTSMYKMKNYFAGFKIHESSLVYKTCFYSHIDTYENILNVLFDLAFKSDFAYFFRIFYCLVNYGKLAVTFTYIIRYHHNGYYYICIISISIEINTGLLRCTWQTLFVGNSKCHARSILRRSYIIWNVNIFFINLLLRVLIMPGLIKIQAWAVLKFSV